MFLYVTYVLLFCAERHLLMPLYMPTAYWNSVYCSCFGMAYWLERWSLAGRLSRYTTDLWLTFDHLVDKVSVVAQPTRPTQPSIPLGSVNELRGFGGVESIKQQIWAACDSLATGSKVPCAQGLASTAYRLHARSVFGV